MKGEVIGNAIRKKMKVRLVGFDGRCTLPTSQDTFVHTRSTDTLDAPPVREFHPPVSVGSRGSEPQTRLLLMLTISLIFILISCQEIAFWHLLCGSVWWETLTESEQLASQ